MSYKLFLDLDGVFADFHKRVFELGGVSPEELSSSNLWKIVHRDKEFFLNLDRMVGFDELWTVAQRFEHVEFLTGAPSSKSFVEQKKEWVVRNFGSQYICNVVARKDKQTFAQGKDVKHILLDDLQKNIDEWTIHGGIGILHDPNQIQLSVTRLEAFL